jgi:predicted DCC family thiol-disulfide oxidoreductase YuxK
MTMTEFGATSPLLIYDGDCAFCSKWITHWGKLTQGRVRFAPFQEVERDYPDISHATFEHGVQLVMPDGTVYRNAEAVFRLVHDTPRRAWLLWCYQHVPGFRPVTEFGYSTIARHRDFGYWATQILWGDPGPHTFILTRWLFLRLLGVIFLIAFGSLAVQMTGLVGSGGILPIGSLLERAGNAYQGADRFLRLPTLLWLDSSNTVLQFLCVGGMALSLLLIFDVLTAPVMLLMYLFYLSLVTAGQTFMTFQWDNLLLEVGFLAIFLAGISLIPRLRNRRQPSLVVIYLFRWLLFRLMLGSGMVKLLSGDPTWRDLTALHYHFYTQPIPNVIAWYVAQLPQWALSAGVLFNFLAELIAPLLYWAPRRIRFVGGFLTIMLQLGIFLTGNFTFFNLLTIVLCIPLFDDQFLRHFVPRRISIPLIETALPAHPSWPRRIGLALLTIFIVGLSYYRFMPTVVGFVSEITHTHLDSPTANTLPTPLIQVANTAYRLRMVGSYGLFATMTTSRPEIIVEGSNDGETWLAYEFHYKIQDVDQPPPWVEPHQPRLAWQLWFAALGGNYQNVDWFPAFAHRLLQGAPDVLALLAKNPFPDAPPKYLRATIQDYQFTTAAERAQTGAWWKVGPPRDFLPVITLDSFGSARP